MRDIRPAGQRVAYEIGGEAHDNQKKQEGEKKG